MSTTKVSPIQPAPQTAPPSSAATARRPKEDLCGDSPRKSPARPILPVHRGLQLLERLDASVFGHEMRNLSLKLRLVAEQPGTADAAARPEALKVPARLWRLYPPGPDPIEREGR